MASPRPLPTNLKVIRGTARPCRLNAKEPTPEKLTSLKAPVWLSSSEKKCWKEVVSKLQAAGIATVIDVSALSAYCKAWDGWRSELEQVKEEGTVVDGSLGNPIVNPRVRIANDYFKQLLALWREFGMTPSSRTRIHSEKDEARDDFDTWQRNQKERVRMAHEGV